MNGYCHHGCTEISPRGWHFAVTVRRALEATLSSPLISQKGQRKEWSDLSKNTAGGDMAWITAIISKQLFISIIKLLHHHSAQMPPSTSTVIFTMEIPSPLWHKRLSSECKGLHYHNYCSRPSTQGSPNRCKFPLQALCAGLLTPLPTIWGYCLFEYNLHWFA